MLSLGELLIKTPENLHNSEGRGGNGIREISTRGRYGTDNGHGTLSVGGSKALNLTSSLIELGELGSQVSGETTISGHFSKTSRDFSKGFSPSGGRVSHHSDIVSHISEVLSKGDSGIDRGLSGCHRHVGGVGHKASTLHDIVFLSVNFNGELGELIEYLSHLISSLATSDVDNTLRVGVLGQGLRDTGLSTSEGSGNSASSSLDGGEKGIQDSLSGKKRCVTSKLLVDGSSLSDGPFVGHADVNLLSVLILNNDDGLVDTVVASGHDLNNSHSLHSGLSHNSMLTEEIVLEGSSYLISAGDHVTNLPFAGGPGPLGVLIEVGYIDTSGDEHRLRHFGNGLEGSLNSIKDSFQDSRSELDLQGVSSSEDRVSNS